MWTHTRPWWSNWQESLLKVYLIVHWGPRKTYRHLHLAPLKMKIRDSEATEMRSTQWSLRLAWPWRDHSCRPCCQRMSLERSLIQERSALKHFSSVMIFLSVYYTGYGCNFSVGMSLCVAVWFPARFRSHHRGTTIPALRSDTLYSR